MDATTPTATRAVMQRPSYLPVRSNTAGKTGATGTQRHMTDTASKTNSKYDRTEPLPSARVTNRFSSDRATSASVYRQVSPHWSLFIGLGMLLLIVLYVLGFTVLVACEDIYNDWTYGKVRTTQLDAVVGDHDSRQHPSHFIVLNLHQHIEIIEFPGGDATHASVFIGPQLTWANADKAYISMKVLDINHDGNLDLDITITGDPVMFSSTPTFHYYLIRTKKGLVYQQA